jgi:hypothetical protein
MTSDASVTGDGDLRFEILLPRPLDQAWLAFRDPVVVRKWYGWEYPGLGPEIKAIFVDTTVANKPARTIHIGGHLFSFAARDDHTHVRVTRAEPIKAATDDVDWSIFYDVIEEGWITFLQQLRFMLARHPQDTRRTIFRVGGARSGVPTPLGDLIGLSEAARTNAGEPYQADVGPGDHLEGEVWFRSGLQLGVTVDGWGDGLLVLSHMPGTPEPFAAASMVLTTYGMDKEAFADLEARWDEWWNKRYEIPEPEPEG